MAIEIRVPELARNSSSGVLQHELVKLIPPIISYTVSFFFIGHIWYQHLQLFSLLKDYDKGLVIRNLIMLFFVAFFLTIITYQLISDPESKSLASLWFISLPIVMRLLRKRIK